MLSLRRVSLVWRSPAVYQQLLKIVYLARGAGWCFAGGLAGLALAAALNHPAPARSR
jgi:hypothetical protein